MKSKYYWTDGDTASLRLKVAYVKTIADLGAFSSDEITEIQNFALESNDVPLYVYIENYWTLD